MIYMEFRHIKDMINWLFWQGNLIADIDYIKQEKNCYGVEYFRMAYWPVVYRVK